MILRFWPLASLPADRYIGQGMDRKRVELRETFVEINGRLAVFMGESGGQF